MCLSKICFAVCWSVTHFSMCVARNMYNSINIVAVEKQLVCSLRYPACKAHAPSYVVCVLFGRTIFFHVISWTAQFFGKVIDHKMCFDFLYKYFPNSSHSKKNSARYCHNCTSVLMTKFNETWIFFTYFQKNTQKSNFVKMRPFWRELFHDDQRTDRNDDASSSFPQFCERHKKKKEIPVW
jgi:hypothetical protein